MGGNPDGRGVVATASYEARRYGIRSAMSSAEARRRCPHVIFVRPDHRAYREWSGRVWALVREMSPVVEQVGIDEGYLVLPDGDPREQAELVQLAVRERMRLSCSLGVATCKVVAKVASDARKPGGVTVVPPGGEAAFLESLPVRTLPGVGPKAEVRLVAAGVATIGALAELDDGRLAELLPGRVGVDLRLRARGIDPRPVSGEPAEVISISNEETFDVDVRDREELYSYLRRMSEGLAASLGRRGMSARTVTTKVRYPDFAIATRSQSLRGRHRRRRDDRRPRVQPARPRATPAARADPPGGRGGLGARPAPPALAAGDRRRADYAVTGRRSSRCWCDGQYSRSGSGVRWHGLPLRVVALHWWAWPSPARSSSSRMCTTAAPMCRSIDR